MEIPVPVHRFGSHGTLLQLAAETELDKMHCTMALQLRAWHASVLLRCSHSRLNCCYDCPYKTAHRLLSSRQPTHVFSSTLYNSSCCCPLYKTPLLVLRAQCHVLHARTVTKQVAAAQCTSVSSTLVVHTEHWLHFCLEHTHAVQAHGQLVVSNSFSVICILDIVFIKHLLALDVNHHKQQHHNIRPYHAKYPIVWIPAIYKWKKTSV